MFTRILTLALALPLLPTASALADDDLCTPEDLPTGLAAAADEKLTFVADAEGVQIYDCMVSGSSYAWTFRAPDATLYAPADEACADGGGDDGVIGSHYAGPTWESSSGGTVVGAVAVKVASPDPDAVPWLRLNAVSHEGNGPLKKVTTIQRLYTVGGKAPASGCDASTVGAELDVPYTATYYFYKR